MNFSEWYFEWFMEYRTKDKSIETYKRYYLAYKQILAHEVGAIDLGKITNEHIQNFLNEYGENKTKSTVKAQLSFIKSCLDDAVKQELILKNPVKSIELNYKEKYMTQLELASKRNEKKWLELDEYYRLNKYLLSWLEISYQKKPFSFSKRQSKNKFFAQVQMTIILVALKTGMRYGEILGFTIHDIDFENKIINIDKTYDYKYTFNFSKTKNISSIRTLMFDDELYEVLLKYVQWKKLHNVSTYKETLFAELDKHYANQDINNQLKNLLTSLGIAPVSFHKLRHTHTSILIAKGIKKEVVAKRLGHSSVGMIDKVYGHLLQSVEREETEKILEIT